MPVLPRWCALCLLHASDRRSKTGALDAGAEFWGPFLAASEMPPLRGERLDERRLCDAMSMSRCSCSPTLDKLKIASYRFTRVSFMQPIKNLFIQERDAMNAANQSYTRELRRRRAVQRCGVLGRAGRWLFGRRAKIPAKPDFRVLFSRTTRTSLVALVQNFTCA